MSVLTGEREEWRRILHEGRPVWTQPEGKILKLADGREVLEEEATYLPPCEPTKILCVHLNYESRFVEFGAENDENPTYFHKPTTTMNAHRGKLHRPENCQYLNYEGEIAAIIGKPMRNVAPEETWSHLAGFAPGNDVGCQDYRDTDRHCMVRVKGMDGFCPIGPGIVRGVDVRESTVRTWINGSVVQEAKVSEMLFGIDEMLADLCRHMTLLPGDVVMTGTPANSRPMGIGDVVEIEVSGLGRLSNTVVEIPAPTYKGGDQPTNSPHVRGVALGPSALRDGEEL